MLEVEQNWEDYEFVMTEYSALIGRINRKYDGMFSDPVRYMPYQYTEKDKRVIKAYHDINDSMMLKLNTNPTLIQLDC